MFNQNIHKIERSASGDSIINPLKNIITALGHTIAQCWYNENI